jgi:HTH-type transcriptional regulator, glycine betaine synthesis regulator
MLAEPLPRVTRPSRRAPRDADSPRSGPARWELLVLEGVGRVVEHWGFKRNQGRIWGLLYLLERPLDATSIARRLELSKAAVSLVVKELEGWGVVRRVPVSSRSGVGYEAERDLWQMLTTVLRRRESRLVEIVWTDLREAERLVLVDPELTPAERKAVAERVRRLRRFAEVAHASLEAFVRSYRLDLAPLKKVLAASLRRVL